MLNAARPLDRFGRNLTFGLFDRIGRAIALGDFEDRPFPTEADLARRYAVSRSVTREATKMLAAKGLLGARPRQGTFVQPTETWNLLDEDVLRWLFERRPSTAWRRRFAELRLAVEPEAAAMAARSSSPVSVASIGSSLGRLRDARQGHGDELDARIAFHTSVLRASGNPFFARFRGLVTVALLRSAPLDPWTAAEADLNEHEAIHAAIVAGRPCDARRSMRRLLGGVLSDIGGERLRE